MHSETLLAFLYDHVTNHVTKYPFFNSYFGSLNLHLSYLVELMQRKCKNALYLLGIHPIIVIIMV